MTPDEDAVVSCVLDYFEGFDGDPERMRRALHPDLAKRSLEEGTLEHVTAPEMVETTAAGLSRTIPAAGVSMFASWTSTETSHLSSSTRTSTANTSTSCASRAAGRSQTPSGSSLRGPILRYALGYGQKSFSGGSGTHDPGLMRSRRLELRLRHRRPRGTSPATACRTLSSRLQRASASTCCGAKRQGVRTSARPGPLPAQSVAPTAASSRR